MRKKGIWIFTIIGFLALGSLVSAADLRFSVGLGYEFLRERRVNIGIEFLYDTSELECIQYLNENQDKTKESMNPTNYVFSLFVTF